MTEKGHGVSLIVITGGSWAGKTAVVDALGQRGHAVLPEAAMQVIGRLTEAHGVEGQAAWRESNIIAFQRMILELQLEQEAVARAANTPLVFCDRGALDGQAYCRIVGREWPDDLQQRVAGIRYAHVFVLDTLQNFNPRHDTGRVHTREDSVRIGAMLHEIYAAHADRVTAIPELAVQERANRIRKALRA